MKTTSGTGTIICATANPRDLTPCFLRAARALADTPAERAELDEIQTRTKAPDYYDNEDSIYDLDALFDMLDEAAPEGHYFGAHPGDGADYGFWPVEDGEG